MYVCIWLEDINHLTTGNLRIFNNTGEVIFKSIYFCNFSLMERAFETVYSIVCYIINSSNQRLCLGILNPEMWKVKFYWIIASKKNSNMFSPQYNTRKHSIKQAVHLMKVYFPCCIRLFSIEFMHVSFYNCNPLLVSLSHLDSFI